MGTLVEEEKGWEELETLVEGGRGGRNWGHWWREKGMEGIGDIGIGGAIDTGEWIGAETQEFWNPNIKNLIIHGN